MSRSFDSKKRSLEISFIGAGNMGVTLVEQWIKSGHHVRFGVRDVSLALKRGERSQVLTDNDRVVCVSQSVRDREVILIAVPGAVVRLLLDSYLRFRWKAHHRGNPSNWRGSYE